MPDRAPLDRIFAALAKGHASIWLLAKISTGLDERARAELADVLDIATKPPVLPPSGPCEVHVKAGPNL